MDPLDERGSREPGFGRRPGCRDPRIRTARSPCRAARERLARLVSQQVSSTARNAPGPRRGSAAAAWVLRDPSGCLRPFARGQDLARAAEDGKRGGAARRDARAHRTGSEHPRGVRRHTCDSRLGERHGPRCGRAPCRGGRARCRQGVASQAPVHAFQAGAPRSPRVDDPSMAPGRCPKGGRLAVLVRRWCHASVVAPALAHAEHRAVRVPPESPSGRSFQRTPPSGRVSGVRPRSRARVQVVCPSAVYGGKPEAVGSSAQTRRSGRIGIRVAWVNGHPAQAAGFSTTMAMPMPTPMHIVASP